MKFYRGNNANLCEQFCLLFIISLQRSKYYKEYSTFTHFLSIYKHGYVWIYVLLSLQNNPILHVPFQDLLFPQHLFGADSHITTFRFSQYLTSVQFRLFIYGQDCAILICFWCLVVISIWPALLYPLSNCLQDDFSSY